MDNALGKVDGLNEEGTAPHVFFWIGVFHRIVNSAPDVLGECFVCGQLKVEPRIGLFEANVDRTGIFDSHILDDLLQPAGRRIFISGVEDGKPDVFGRRFPPVTPEEVVLDLKCPGFEIFGDPDVFNQLADELAFAVDLHERRIGEVGKHGEACVEKDVC